MSTLFVLLFLTSLGLLTWGLIAPKSLAKQANKATKKELTRKHFAVFFGLAAFMFLILTAKTVPSTAQQGGSPQTNQTQQTVQEPKVETKEETETKEIAFTSSTVNDASMAQGTSKVTTAGVNGVQTLTYKVTYTDGKETAKELVSDTVTTAPVNQVTTVGTYVAPVVQAPAPAPAQSGARTGATCNDGSHSNATGRGACSHHGGVRVWLYN